MMDNLILAFLALGLLDALTTYIAIKSQAGTEANGILATAMRKLGLVPTLILKLILTGGIGYYYYQHRTDENLMLGLVAVVVIYLLVVLNNAKIIGWIK